VALVVTADPLHRGSHAFHRLFHTKTHDLHDYIRHELPCDALYSSQSPLAGGDSPEKGFQFSKDLASQQEVCVGISFHKVDFHLTVIAESISSVVS